MFSFLNLEPVCCSKIHQKYRINVSTSLWPQWLPLQFSAGALQDLGWRLALQPQSPAMSKKSYWLSAQHFLYLRMAVMISKLLTCWIPAWKPRYLLQDTCSTAALCRNWHTMSLLVFPPMLPSPFPHHFPQPQRTLVAKGSELEFWHAVF